jgi:flavin reductase (DIM6/NTAB) family NADH-FMN oxidoreductase RutF
MTVSVTDFKNALQLWASGVTVVTTQSEKFGVQGMTVSAFSSVSVNPPLILVCINDAADTGSGIAESQYFAVNVLTSEQQNVSNEFAGGASQQQRFANVGWSVATTGAPVLNNTLMWLDCTVVEKVRAGTHWVIIGEVQACECRSGEPLLYYSGAYRQIAKD